MITALFPPILSSFARIDENGNDTWHIVFIIIGIAVLISGIVGLFTIKDPVIESKKDEPYFKNIFYGFRPDVIKSNKTLYIILIGFAIFGISLQVYMPYYILYLQHAESLKNIPLAAAIGFDGYAIGGLAVGEPAEVMYDIIEKVTPHMPQNKIRYLMGVGTPANILNAVERGVDLFDCVMPSRNARHGHLFTSEGIININNK